MLMSFFDLKSEYYNTKLHRNPNPFVIPQNTRQSMSSNGHLEGMRMTNAFMVGGVENMKLIRKMQEPVLKYSITLNLIQTSTIMAKQLAIAGIESEYENIDKDLDEGENTLRDYEEIISENPDATTNGGISMKVSIEKQKRRISNLERSKSIALKNQEMCDTFFTELIEHLEDLADWVRQPIYDPDHPFGSHMMKGTEKSYCEHAENSCCDHEEPSVEHNGTKSD